MELKTKNHSKYLLMAHLIFVCKYRKKLLFRYRKEIKSIFSDIADLKGFTISEMEVDKDHIHVLVSYEPKMSILSIVRDLKQISTFRVWRQNDNLTHLSNEFWKENTFWSDGYFACSVGNASAETVKRYIESQG